MAKFEDYHLRDSYANRPAAGVIGRFFFDTTNIKMQRDNGSAWEDVEGGGAWATITNASAFLTSDLSMPNAAQWYDGPELSLAAGTWLVMASVSILSGAHINNIFSARLWDGSNIYAESAGPLVQDWGVCSIMITAIITLGTTTIVKISAYNNQASSGAIIDATQVNDGSANKATWINAVKLTA